MNKSLMNSKNKISHVMSPMISHARRQNVKSSLKNDNVIHSVIMDRTELDSHADTCCIGANATVIEFTGRICDVSPFSDSYSPVKDISVVKAATAYDTPEGVTYVLIINEALDMRAHMAYSLLNPNQLRANGVVVDDVPSNINAFYFLP